MIKNIIHNSIFRIISPVFYGLVMYILILLIFDSIEQLSNNFFSIEVFLCIIISVLVFEITRIYILILEKRCSVDYSNQYRIILQGLGSVIISLLLTSLIVSFYFSKLVQFNTYRTELIVFNTIFIITSLLYNMIYFSFFYLNKKNISELEKENILRQGAEVELDTFKNKINPGFLYDSLEILIGLSKKDTEEADQFIQNLSDVYRNILSTKNSELNSLLEEIKIAENLVSIINYKTDNHLKFNFDKKADYNNFKIIKGTFIVVFEDIINRSVVSRIQPLEVKLKLDDNILKIYHTKQNKLQQIFSKHHELEHLKSAYLMHTESEFTIIEDDIERAYTIPVFKS